MRPYTLTAPKTGISRLRAKGGAREDSLYDLINGQFNASREIVPRPGSLVFDTIESGVSPTFGLAYYKSLYHVFSDEWSTLVGANTILHVLPHPTPIAEGGPRMVAIHKAEPFLGYLFVIAEYDNGDVRYFFLTEGVSGGEAWQADHVYAANHMVRPTTPTGYYYRATRLGPPGKRWAAGDARAVNDIVEPTKFNGFEYVVIEAAGTNPRSGATEPVWPKIDGAEISEYVDGNAPEDPGDDDDSGTIPEDVDDRYNWPTRNTGDPSRQVQ